MTLPCSIKQHFDSAYHDLIPYFPLEVALLLVPGPGVATRHKQQAVLHQLMGHVLALRPCKGAPDWLRFAPCLYSICTCIDLCLLEIASRLGSNHFRGFKGNLSSDMLLRVPCVWQALIKVGLWALQPRICSPRAWNGLLLRGSVKNVQIVSKPNTGFARSDCL